MLIILIVLVINAFVFTPIRFPCYFSRSFFVFKHIILTGFLVLFFPGICGPFRTSLSTSNIMDLCEEDSLVSDSSLVPEEEGGDPMGKKRKHCSTQFLQQTALGAKYLGFFSSPFLKRREKCISFAQLDSLSLYIF